jgi:thymidylate kinase
LEHSLDITPAPVDPGSRRVRLLFGSAVVVAFAAAVLLHLSEGYDALLAALFLMAGTVIGLLSPSLDYRLVGRPMGKLVAFVGCDGSGKSTLTGDLARQLGDLAAVRICYLGLGSGALGERIKRAPIVGSALERRLARKASQSRAAGGRIPGLPTATVIYLFSLLRLRRFKKMLRLRQHGFVVLTDRYPQTECPGFYDGPGLAAAAAGSWAVAKLVERERRIYAWMTAFRPDMVVRLNVDADTALARKPEHRPDLIRRKVAITPKLRFAGAPIVDLDATLPYPAVHALADRIVRRTLAARGRPDLAHAA